MKFYTTPGPWQAHEVDTGWYVGHGNCVGTDYVADVHKWVDGDFNPDLDKQARANKQAIEAVPDMITLLNDLHGHFQRFTTRDQGSGVEDDYFHAIKDVLKKAGGEE